MASVTEDTSNNQHKDGKGGISYTEDTGNNQHVHGVI